MPSDPRRGGYLLEWVGLRLATGSATSFFDAVSRNAPTRHVLLIDDSHEDLFLAKRLLVKAGAMAPIVAIDNGEQALAYLRVAAENGQNPLVPAIVFCDVQMPALDGLALLRCLRDEERLPDVPFYMLTGGDIETEKARARELGAAGFLKKFPSPGEFNRLLAQAGLA